MALAATFAALVFASPPALAEEEPLTPGEGYRISVLTMGPGGDLFTLFGHDALLVERAGTPALVYNFGMYTQAGIAPHHILGGTLRYFLSVNYFKGTVAAYSSENRSVIQQVLDLDPATAARLAAALSENSKPQNTGYAYDFALDNCTTRVRDHLDRALGGALRAELRGVSALTYRDHALRFAARDWPLYFLFDVGLGRSVDRPLERWDDAYLPDRLAAELRRARLSQVGGVRPLVQREKVLFAASRAPLRDAPPVRAPWHALAGLTLGGLLFLAGRRGTRLSRVALGAGSALLGLLVGVLGLFVLLLLVTDVHVASHQNYNVLVCPPWALGLVWNGLAAAFGSPKSLRCLTRAAGQSAFISVVGTLAALALGQDSLRVALLVVPLLGGAWLGARTVEKRDAPGATPA